MEKEKEGAKPLDIFIAGHVFRKKPLLIGGRAMECYDLRKAGDDIDLLVAEEDFHLLASHYSAIASPMGDEGVRVETVELWKTSWRYSYEQLLGGAEEEARYFIIAREALFFLKALSAFLHSDAKSDTDARLLAPLLHGDDWSVVPFHKR